ncbi:MAG TPA: phage tail protein [Blastocatellia bacterium]|nr:phage tail protein [Blastocatellia bacterium]
MAQFTVNTQRIDPYSNFKFRVKWQSEPGGTFAVVAGVSKVGALKRTTEVISHREGGDISTQRHSPGASKFDAITLERGITFDPEFEKWANLVYSTEGDGAVSLANFRKDIMVEFLNLQGTIVKRYRVFRCWVSEFTALPELDANANAIAFEHIVLQNEGFERDESVVEVAET